MPGLSASLYVGLSGLQAQQSALNVVGHNIANVNTPGYTREVANLTSNQSLVQGQAYFGTGVSLNTVTSIRNKFLDLQIAQETAVQAGSADRYTGVSAVSNSLGDTSSAGIAAEIQTFFQGFQTLAGSPESSAVRTSVVSDAQSMINVFQSNYQLLDQQRSGANQAVGSLVTQVNTLTAQIAHLTQQITGSDSQGSDNDAVDQRTALTNQLSQLVGINVIDGSNGQYQITLDSGAGTLVAGTTSFNLQTAPGGAALDNYSAVQAVMNGTTVDVTSSIKNGQLGAQLDLRDNIYVGFQRQLDQLAAGIAVQVNTLHEKGYAADGTTTGTDFFRQNGVANYAASNLPLGQVAGLPTTISSLNNYKGMVNSLSVNAAIVTDPSLIAAAGPLVPPAVTAAPGDNTNANAIGSLQSATKTVDTNGNGIGDSGPFSDVVENLVSDVGNQSHKFQSQSTTQQNLVSALQTQRDQVSGVSLNEEAANLLNLQSGYQASARFINVISQLTEQLITQFGQ
jgi:flagellar hook-associated protein 1 FlgK